MTILTRLRHSILSPRAPLGRTLAVATVAVMLLASACSQVVEPAAVDDPAAEPAVDDPAAEPAATEPAADDPVAVEPAAAEPVVDDPAAVEPAAAEPVVVEPVAVEPVVDDPVAVEPVVDDPVAVEPVVDDPVAVEPVVDDPVVDDPVVVEPVVEPVVDDPAAVEPVVDDPVVDDPVVDDPVVDDPVAVEPVVDDPVVEPVVEPVVDPVVDDPVVEPVVDPVVEPVVVDPEVHDPVVVEPVVDGPEVAWMEPYAGYVPEVHPDTPTLSWELGHDAPTPEGLPALVWASADGDMPRPTPGVVEWSRWCVANTRSSQCADALHQSVWALDYLGASESCVIEQMTRQVNGFVRWETPVSHSDSGWFRCPTVILPDPAGDGDAPLLVQSLADRCRGVLPPDVDLVSYRLLVGGLDPSQATADEIEAAIGADPAQMTPDEIQEHFEYVPVLGASCDEWAQTETIGAVPEYFSLQHTAKLLVVEWMQHHYGAPPRGEWSVL